MTPEERQAFGRRLAAERAARGLTQRALAVRVCAALPDAQRPDLATVEGYVKRWEAGRAGIGERNRLALAEALGIEDADLFGGRSGPPRRETDEERRRLLACLGLLGVDAGVADEPLEPIRQALADAIPGGPRDRLIADWEEVAFEYGHAFLTAPPGALLPDLAHDLVRLQRIVRAVDDAGARRGLCAPAGKLAALVAMTVATLGHARQARDWWKTARHTADASADRNLRVWVRGYESMSALYAGRPLAPVLRLADEAIAIAGSSSGAAVLEAMAARAQALALLGRTGDAAGAVRAMEDRFERLPQAPADERLSTGAWPETALRHTAAFTYTCVRDAARAERAQADALRLYPEGMKRQRAQIELLRATCLVQAGDVAAGVAHASRAVGSLSRSQRTATVARGARMVLDAVPETRRERSCVRELRELASPGACGRTEG